MTKLWQLSIWKRQRRATPISFHLTSPNWWKESNSSILLNRPMKSQFVYDQNPVINLWLQPKFAMTEWKTMHSKIQNSKGSLLTLKNLRLRRMNLTLKISKCLGQYIVNKSRKSRIHWWIRSKKCWKMINGTSSKPHQWKPILNDKNIRKKSSF